MNTDSLENVFDQMNKDDFPISENLSFAALEQKIVVVQMQMAPKSWAIVATVLLLVAIGLNTVAYQKNRQKPTQDLLQQMDLLNNHSIYNTDEQG